MKGIILLSTSSELKRTRTLEQTYSNKKSPSLSSGLRDVFVYCETEPKPRFVIKFYSNMASSQLSVAGAISVLAMYGPPAFAESGTLFSVGFAVIAFVMTAVSLESFTTLYDIAMHAEPRSLVTRKGNWSLVTQTNAFRTTISAKQCVVGRPKIFDVPLKTSAILHFFGGNICAAGYEILIVLHMSSGIVLKISSAIAMLQLIIREYGLIVSREMVCGFLTMCCVSTLWISSKAFSVVKLLTDLVFVVASGVLLYIMGHSFLAENHIDIRLVEPRGIWSAITGVLLSFTFHFQTPATFARGPLNARLSLFWQMAQFGSYYIFISVLYNASLPNSVHPLRLVVFNFVGDGASIAAPPAAKLVFALVPLAFAIGSVGVTSTQIFELSTHRPPAKGRIFPTLLVLLFGTIALDTSQPVDAGAALLFSGCAIHCIFIVLHLKVSHSKRLLSHQISPRTASFAAIIFWLVFALTFVRHIHVK